MLVCKLWPMAGSLAHDVLVPDSATAIPELGLGIKEEERAALRCRGARSCLGVHWRERSRLSELGVSSMKTSCRRWGLQVSFSWTFSGNPQFLLDRCRWFLHQYEVPCSPIYECFWTFEPFESRIRQTSQLKTNMWDSTYIWEVSVPESLSTLMLFHDVPRCSTLFPLQSSITAACSTSC